MSCFSAQCLFPIRNNKNTRDALLLGSEVVAMIDVERVQELHEVGLVAAVGEFFGHVGEVGPLFTEGNVHPLEVLVVWSGR